MKATILYECPNNYSKTVIGVFTSKKALGDTSRNIIENRVELERLTDDVEDPKELIKRHLECLFLEKKTTGLFLGELEIEEFTVNEVITDE